MKNKGFTLIEIIIVIVILGIMAAVALPKITGQIDRGRLPQGLEQLGKIQREQDQCLQMEGTSVTNCDSLTELGYASDVITVGAWTFSTSSTSINGWCGTVGANACASTGTLTFSITSTFGTGGGITVNTKAASGAFSGFKFKQ